MTKIYELVERSGTKAIPVGERYEIVQAVVGAGAFIAYTGGQGGGFVTSPIKKITSDNDELILVTKNTVYTFKEVSE